jgi:hypothetical protein
MFTTISAIQDHFSMLYTGGKVLMFQAAASLSAKLLTAGFPALRSKITG